jgi:hypothetical protein
VIYNAASGEPRVHADSEGELDLFRLAFGLHGADLLSTLLGGFPLWAQVCLRSR